MNAWNTLSSVRWSPSACANLSRAASASLAASRGLRKTCGTDSIATIVRISLEQPSAGAATTALASCGSRGSSAIIAPTGVSSPSSSRAPR